MRQIVGSIEGEYRRYKALGEGAIEQLSDQQLSQVGSAGENSIATLVWHVSGNLVSRFTDFLESDGEKPWRDRDAEFLPRTVTGAELRAEWEKGWTVLFRSLADLDDESLHALVKIRGVGLSVHEALHRSLAHTSYHVGQIVFLAKALRGGGWRYLSIPPGGSAAYNENPADEKPPAPSKWAHGSSPPMIRVLVSSCLLGERVRYHGGDARCESTILDRWNEEGRLVSACPETAGGLPVPRPPAEITGGDGNAVLQGKAYVGDGTGTDVTAVFLKGARATLETALARGVRLAVLKDGSPSCATTYIHDGSFRAQRGPGLGVTAALLAQAGIRVFSERQWEEAAAYLATLEAAPPQGR